MHDLQYLPSDLQQHQVFTVPSTVTNLQWHTWTKPRGARMVAMTLLSGGGGGGGGFTGTAASARGGGGGGGSSGITRVLIPAALLPDRLFVQVGAGGVGVASGGGTAPSGLLSYVCVYPDTTAQNVVALSGAVGPTGGGTGTAAAVGAAGAAGTIAVIGSMPLAGLGQFAVIGGNAGGAGGAVAGAAGSAAALLTTSCNTTGGAGGGGTTSADFAGGTVTGVANTFLTANILPAAAAAGSFNGSGGITLWQPFYTTGGTGGGSSNASTGGNGGNGAFGSGGGGGGGGTTGGKGGDGGSGIVIIDCW